MVDDDREVEREDAVRMAAGKTREVHVRAIMTAVIVIDALSDVEDLGPLDVFMACGDDWEIKEIF